MELVYLGRGGRKTCEGGKFGVSKFTRLWNPRVQPLKTLPVLRRGLIFYFNDFDII